MATDDKHCLKAVLNVDLDRLNTLKTRYTMEVHDDGVVTLTYLNNGVRTKKIYYPLQAQLLEALSKNDHGARDTLSPDLRCRYDVLENLKVEIAAESILCQQEASDIARIWRSNPAEAARRRIILDVRNKIVGARGNELGHQRAALNRDIEEFKRKSRAASLAPRNPNVPTYSNPSPFTLHPIMNLTQYSPQVAYAPQHAYAYAPPSGPKALQSSQSTHPNQPTVFQTRNSVQYQYLTMSRQATPLTYGQQQPVPQPASQPAPHPATFLLDPNSSRHQHKQHNPTRAQAGYQQPAPAPSRPEHGCLTEHVLRHHSDYYRPGYAERDGDYYRPQYSQQAPLSVPPLQAKPLDQGRLTNTKENTAPSTTRHQQLQLQPQPDTGDTRIALPFPNPTGPPSRLNPQFLRPIQNMIRNQESAKRPAKRKAEEGEVDESRRKREKVESELPIPYPNEPLSYDDLPLYTASPPRPRHGV